MVQVPTSHRIAEKGPLSAIILDGLRFVYPRTPKIPWLHPGSLANPVEDVLSGYVPLVPMDRDLLPRIRSFFAMCCRGGFSCCWSGMAAPLTHSRIDRRASRLPKARIWPCIGTKKVLPSHHT